MKTHSLKASLPVILPAYKGFKNDKFQKRVPNKEMSYIYQWGTKDCGHKGGQIKACRLKQYQVNEEVEEISCGHSHYMIQTSDGLLGWGNNEYGQLGFDGSSFVEELVQLPPLNRKIVSISCGQSHTLLLDEGGNVLSAGYGRNGALGYGRGNTSYDFKHVLSNMCFISAGTQHSLALSQTKVYGWGSSKDSQLGLLKQKIYYEPTQLYAYASYYCFAGSTYSIFGTTRGIFATGLNSQGQLGFGHQKKVSFPKQTKLDGKIKWVKGGGSYIMIQLEHGQLYMCGNGCFGKYILPTKIEFFRNCSSLALADRLGISKSEDDKIFVWGSNIDGKLLMDVHEEINHPMENPILEELGMDAFEIGEKMVVGVRLKKEKQTSKQCRKNTSKQLIKSSIDLTPYHPTSKQPSEIIVSQEHRLHTSKSAKMDSKQGQQNEQSERMQSSVVFKESFPLKQPEFSPQEIQYSISLEEKSPLNGSESERTLQRRIWELQKENKTQQSYIGKLQKQYIMLINMIQSDTIMKRMLEMKMKNIHLNDTLQETDDDIEDDVERLKTIVHGLL